jgi:hypothetical protein
VCAPSIRSSLTSTPSGPNWKPDPEPHPTADPDASRALAVSVRVRLAARPGVGAFRTCGRSRSLPRWR